MLEKDGKKIKPRQVAQSQMHQASYLKVGSARCSRIRRHLDIVHRNGLSALRRHAHINRGRAKAAALLKEVVVLATRRLPRVAAVGADLEARHRLVRVDHLHAEPVGRHAVLVVQDNGRLNAALDPGVVNRDDAPGRVGERAEGIGEEVEMAGGA